MDWFSRAFIKASVTWLALGVTLGVAMAMMPSWTIHRTAHLHMNLLGFVAMMIFGVAYHVLPRFVGAPLHDRRLASAHWWLANIGLTLMVAGFALRTAPIVPPPVSAACLAIGGALSAVGAYAFAYNVWRTVGAPAVVRNAAATAEPVRMRMRRSRTT